MDESDVDSVALGDTIHRKTMNIITATMMSQLVTKYAPLLCLFHCTCWPPPGCFLRLSLLLCFFSLGIRVLLNYLI